MDPSMHSAVEEHFRTPAEFIRFGTRGALRETADHFYLGPGIPCYGRRWQGALDVPRSGIPDILSDVEFEDGRCVLPFNPTEVAQNLRREIYQPTLRRGLSQNQWLRRFYYFLRPVMPLGVRAQAQRIALRRSLLRSFPTWPVDRTVDTMSDAALALTLKARSLKAVPFIWFWPEGMRGCVLMTHDVETRSGLEACDSLMALDQAFGIPASFQLIPHARYRVTQEILSRIRGQGFEVNLHDWNHDGFLFRDKRLFRKRAVGMNASAAAWNAKGFRAGALYRNLDWLQSLDVEYDMSVPNVGHMDPQPGGCCTVFPWIEGRLLEIPVTMVQDHTLFHILNDYSLDLWKWQMGLVLEGYGLASFIVHPDYIQEPRAQAVYRELLALLWDLRIGRNLWVTLPSEVNLWWRQRAQMQLLHNQGQWTITGPGSDRARIAFAHLKDNQLVFTIPSPNEPILSSVSPAEWSSSIHN